MTALAPRHVSASPAIETVLAVNGTDYPVDVDPRASLLDTLRERLHLTGTKKGCDQGACGACTVHVDGRRVLSCLTLAVACQDKAITTIEGLCGQDGGPHPMQEAFAAADGFQCGYCTPGQIMSAVLLAGEGHDGSDAEIQEWMSGNLCRCGAYFGMLQAIRSVRDASPAPEGRLGE
jgi:xanthine dehydrogenase YagT iron-sulfur-binding subunit